MYKDKRVSSDSSDSGYDSLEGSIDTTNNKGRLSIFTLGKIYRWLARGKIMAIFAKSFLMSSKPLDSLRPVPIIKEKLGPKSTRYQFEGVERRAFPDPANNLDDADRNVKMFDDPKLIKKWIRRAHGNNEVSARIYRSFVAFCLLNDIEFLILFRPPKQINEQSYELLASGQLFMNPPRRESLYSARLEKDNRYFNRK